MRRRLNSAHRNVFDSGRAQPHSKTLPRCLKVFTNAARFWSVPTCRDALPLSIEFWGQRQTQAVPATYFSKSWPTQRMNVKHLSSDSP